MEAILKRSNNSINGHLRIIVLLVGLMACLQCRNCLRMSRFCGDSQAPFPRAFMGFSRAQFSIARCLLVLVFAVEFTVFFFNDT